MFDGRWRAGVDRSAKPFAALVRRLGVTANQVTFLGLMFAAATCALIATGRIGAGVATGVACGLTDLIDGSVAKVSGTQSQRGALLDSVADRVTDSLMLGGVAWYLASTAGAHAAVLMLAILAAANLVSYERAKAESLGLDAKGGLMERAERLIAIGLGLVIRPLMFPLLWLVLGLTLLTAVIRFARVWSQASAPPARAGAWRPARVESRWRSWRERAVLRSARASSSSAPLGRWRARRQAVMSSRASRSGRRAGRAARDDAPAQASSGSPRGSGTGRRRVTEALRRRVDGTP